MNQQGSIAALAASCALQPRIDALFPGDADPGISIALHVSGRKGFAGNAASACVRPGCTTKLMTASLLRSLLRERKLSWDAGVAALLDSHDARLTATLEGVSLRHLLEHRHGLDSTGIGQLRRRSDGRLDSDSFLRQLNAAGRLAPPGEVCSYGDAGIWLAALIVEKAYGQPFADLLRQRLRVSVDAALANGSAVCPAMGGDLVCPIEALLAFLESEMQPGAAGLLGTVGPAELAAQIVPRSGWSSVDYGIFLAWAYYGNGWLGHNSIHPCAPLMVRINPARSIALLVATRRANPTLVAARIFGRSLPELFRIRSPALMRKDALGDMNLDAFSGRYANQAVQFRITTEGDHSVSVTVSQRDAAALPWQATASFAIAQDNVLVARNPQPRLPRFLQLITPQQGRYRYLWDGEAVLPRMADFSETPC